MCICGIVLHGRRQPHPGVGGGVEKKVKVDKKKVGRKERGRKRRKEKEKKGGGRLGHMGS